MKKLQFIIAMLLVGSMGSEYAFAKAYLKPTHLETVISASYDDDFQQFTSHQVKSGETIASIAKKFNVSEKEIYKFNPDAKIRIYKGLVLIIPATPKGGGVTGGTEGKPEDVPVEQADTDEQKDFITHKVRRKESLPGLAKSYGVSENEIKRYNKSLYSKPLRKGDVIKIPLTVSEVDMTVKEEKVTLPKPKKVVETKAETTVVKPVSTSTQVAAIPAPKVSAPEQAEVSTPVYETVTTTKNIEYVAKKQETKYGISKAYGITVAELEQLNPQIVDGLKEGATILVPITVTEQVQVPSQPQQIYDQVYEVAPGDTMYSLPRKLDITLDELLTLNPDLESGLKAGMILTLPSLVEVPETESGTGISTRYTFPNSKVVVNLRDSIADRSVKNIAVMLPFGLSKLNTAPETSREELIKKNAVMRIALDFHTGVVLAQEMAKMDGISSIVNVYDTDYVKSDGASVNSRKVENIILSNDFKNVDAVVGPVLGANVNRAASLLALNNIPVISPITSSVELRSNVFQSRPSGSVLTDKMVEYLKKYGQDKHIMIISDKKNRANANRVRTLFKEMTEVTPREGDNGYYFNPDDISKYFIVPDEDGVLPETTEEPKSWWVILESNDIPLISTVTTDLNALSSYNDITLFTTNKGSAFESDEIQNEQLSNLNFHYPSMDKPYDEEQHLEFKNMYQDRYGVTPNTYALRGFDIMYDTLLRLAYKGDLYEAAKTSVETEQLENKFMYVKKPFGGYQNNAVYIIKYGEGLTLKEVIPPVLIEHDVEQEGKE